MNIAIEKIKQRLLNECKIQLEMNPKDKLSKDIKKVFEIIEQQQTEIKNLKKLITGN